jgi:hypothetical protein
VDKLPIVTNTGQVVGTGTPIDTPPPATPTVVPAPIDNDSAQAPAIDIVFSATSTRSIQYTSDISAPNGDADDWLQFTPFTQTVHINITCIGNGILAVEVLQNNQPIQNINCGANEALTTVTGIPYVLHVQAIPGNELNYTRYTVTIDSIQ